MAMLKADWDRQPGVLPNPRVTLEVENTLGTERALLARGIKVYKPVRRFGSLLVGGFADSEGHAWWFCGPVDPDA